MKKKGLALVLAALLWLMPGCAGAESAACFGETKVEHLVVYTSHNREVYGPIVKEFQERTGIWVEVRQGGSRELMKRILLEQQKDELECDLLFGGSLELHQENAEHFVEYQCPESSRMLLGAGRSLKTGAVFSYLPLVFVFNTKLLDESEAPKSWAELASPHWKNRVAFANPEVSESCYTALSTMVQVAGGAGWEQLAGFKRNLEEGEFGGSSEILQAVAGGAYPVGITLEEAALRLEAEGEPIGIIYPKEGTSAVPDATSIPIGAKNLENARLFLDFTVSRDIQGMLSTEFLRRPVRMDVNPPPGIVPIGEIAWEHYDLGWSTSHREEVLTRWASQ